MLNLLKTATRGLLHLFFPNTCLACAQELVQGETHLCLRCFFALPATHFFRHPENAIEQRLRGRVRFEAAVAVYFFSKDSPLQHVLHALKYQNKPELGHWLGQCIAQQARGTDWFKDVDYVVPVPLSRRKLKARGYNQSTCLAEGIAQETGIPVNTQNFIRHRNTQTQTRKTRTERRQNVSGAFSVTNPEKFKNKQIVLLDDVFTTGATLEACLETLQTIPGLRIRVLTLACAIE